jgi:hypothetical protein
MCGGINPATGLMLSLRVGGVGRCAVFKLKRAHLPSVAAQLDFRGRGQGSHVAVRGAAPSFGEDPCLEPLQGNRDAVVVVLIVVVFTDA